MIDFIKEIFFFDYPGLSLAIDPISLITILGPQVAQFIGGRAKAKALEVDRAGLGGNSISWEKTCLSFLWGVPSRNI